MSTTGASRNETVASRTRHKGAPSEFTEEDMKETLKHIDAREVNNGHQDALYKLESVAAPIIFTIMGFFTRMYRIGANNHVVWDEAHFGKFGSYYLRHEFYHDVHPPLGKMLVGLSGYLANYNGSWDFPSGQEYPEYIDFVKMRLFNACFSSLCVPLAYFTMKEMGFQRKTVWLFTLMVIFENSYATLGRFILLDSMLLFFTVSTIYCFAKFHTENKSKQAEFSRKWWKWILLTGLSIGCTCSVKMVGLFVTTLVGIYTAVDLWNMFGDRALTWKKYAAHWLARIGALILVPMFVFLLCFKVHFDLLSGTGPGDANMSSLFQANLHGSDVGGGPRDLLIGTSRCTLKSQGLAGGLLHSHVQTFPGGSNQQQITTYSHKDANNEWTFELSRDDPRNGFKEDHFVVDGMTVRLVHPNTGRNLHTHDIPGPVSRREYEVSGYGNATIGDEKDDWIVEVVDHYGSEDKLRLHPLTTSFRLRSKPLGCYLATSGQALPAWGFRQGEVICMKDPFKRDKRTWWNIENHENPTLPQPPADFKLPKTNFLKDFVQLNLAMMATNNALVPDADKQDDLASAAWQWPTLNVGIRLCGWNDESYKYFLIGSPATTWTSSVAVIFCMGLIVYYLIRWQRQCVDFPAGSKKLDKFLMGAVYPLLGWGLHFMPFVIMARVTYVHHYLPALYFAMIIFCYVVESGTSKIPYSAARYGVYAILYTAIVGVFYWLSPISFGMLGNEKEFAYLNVLESWRVSDF